MKNWKAALLILLAVTLWILNHYYFHFTPGGVRDAILSFGVWAPAIYILVYTIRPLLFFPASILCLAGGLAFGPVWGTIYTLFGFTGDSILVFLLARRFGNRFIRSEHPQLAMWKERLSRHGFWTVFTLRLIPVIPFDVTSLAAGLSRLPFLPYVVSTVLGTIPVTIAYSYLGSSLHAGIGKQFMIALVIVLLLALLPLWWMKRRAKNSVNG